MFPKSRSEDGWLLALGYVLTAIAALVHLTDSPSPVLGLTLFLPLAGLALRRTSLPPRVFRLLEGLVFGMIVSALTALALPPLWFGLPLEFPLYVAPVVGLIYAFTLHEGFLTRLALLAPALFLTALTEALRTDPPTWQIAEAGLWWCAFVLVGHLFWEKSTSRQTISHLAAFSLAAALRALWQHPWISPEWIWGWIVLSLILGWQVSEPRSHRSAPSLLQSRTETVNEERQVRSLIVPVTLVAALAVAFHFAVPKLRETVAEMEWPRRTASIPPQAREDASPRTRTEVAGEEQRPVAPPPRGERIYGQPSNEGIDEPDAEPALADSRSGREGPTPSFSASSRRRPVVQELDPPNLPSSAPAPQTIEDIPRTTPSSQSINSNAASESPTAKRRPPELPSVRVDNPRDVAPESPDPDNLAEDSPDRTYVGATPDLLQQANRNAREQARKNQNNPEGSNPDASVEFTVTDEDPPTRDSGEDETIYSFEDLGIGARENEEAAEKTGDDTRENLALDDPALESILEEARKEYLAESRPPPISNPGAPLEQAAPLPPSPSIPPSTTPPSDVSDAAPASDASTSNSGYFSDQNWAGSFSEITFSPGSDGLLGQLIPPKPHSPRQLYLRQDTLERLTPRGFLSGDQEGDRLIFDSSLSPPPQSFRNPRNPSTPTWWSLELRRNASPLLLAPNTFAAWELPFEAETRWNLDEHTIRLGRTARRLDVRFAGIDSDAAPPATPEAIAASLELYDDEAANARLRDLAAEISGQRERSPRAFLIRALGFLHREKSYSLRPSFEPNALPDLVAWTENGSTGYCQHFAGALALLARAQGIPARVVVGVRLAPEDYLRDRYAITEQSLHAWVEVADSGYWHRVEATPASADFPSGTEDLSVSDLGEFETFDSRELVEMETEAEMETETPVASGLTTTDSGKEGPFGEENVAPNLAREPGDGVENEHEHEEIDEDEVEGVGEWVAENPREPNPRSSAENHKAAPATSTFGQTFAQEETSTPLPPPQTARPPPTPTTRSPETAAERPKPSPFLAKLRERLSSPTLALGLLFLLAGAVALYGLLRHWLPKLLRASPRRSNSGLPPHAEPSHEERSLRRRAGVLLTTWENRWLSRRSPPPESSDEASPTVHRDLLRLRYGAGPQSDELDLIESQIDSISTPRRRERRN